MSFAPTPARVMTFVTASGLFLVLFYDLVRTFRKYNRYSPFSYGQKLELSATIILGIQQLLFVPALVIKFYEEDNKDALDESIKTAGQD